MEEQTISAEERLKEINAERKTLKARVLSEREIRLAEAAKMRVSRDEKIEKIQAKLKNILAVIFAYNKLGKVNKCAYDIFGKISEEINCPDEEEFLGDNSTTADTGQDH